MAQKAPLPSGDVTFAFTDIEGSTARWERDRAAMENALRRHDAILRTAITEHGGHIFKAMGDAFFSTQGRCAKAESLQTRSLAIREKALGPDHPEVAASLNDLAAAYHD